MSFLDRENNLKYIFLKFETFKIQRIETTYNYIIPTMYV